MLTVLTCYLLNEKCDNRLKATDELVAGYHLSVGLTQAVLETLESSGATRIECRGHNGGYLVEMGNRTLLKHADINSVVCAMPLPYTRLHEGLASGLKAQFNGISSYYVHVCGVDIRVEYLLNDVYDMAVASRLAAESHLAQDRSCIALASRLHIYVDGHQLVYRKGESATVKRAGLDNRPTDQKIMTEACFDDRDVELIDMPYHKSLQRIAKGDVDAVIWNMVVEVKLIALGLRITPSTNGPWFLQATEVVVLTWAEDYPTQQLLWVVVNKEVLLAHQ